MNSMRIINPGLLTTIQDMGRVGYQQYGVPVAGAMDSVSLQLANILVGNNRNNGALEITMMGPTIEFNSNLAIAITGAVCTIKINEKVVDMYKTIYVTKGDILTISSAKKGLRSYLSVSGGLKIPLVMESKSTYLRGEIGGFLGRKLKSGDVIELNQDKEVEYFGVRTIPQNLLPVYKREVTLRVILGPEENYFTEEGLKTFFKSEYVLTNECDRMGYRLSGAKINHKNGADIISSGITLGAIQVPSHGEPIIMMADRQTTGGYTKIANVITDDIPSLAQLKPGDKVRFEKISIDEAHMLIKEKEKMFIELINDFDLQSRTLVGKIRNFRIGINSKQYNVTLQEIE